MKSSVWADHADMRSATGRRLKPPAPSRGVLSTPSPSALTFTPACVPRPISNATHQHAIDAAHVHACGRTSRTPTVHRRLQRPDSPKPFAIPTWTHPGRP